MSWHVATTLHTHTTRNKQHKQLSKEKRMNPSRQHTTQQKQRVRIDGRKEDAQKHDAKQTNKNRTNTRVGEGGGSK